MARIAHSLTVGFTGVGGYTFQLGLAVSSCLRGLHSGLVRDPSFSRLTDADVGYFRSVVGDSGVVTSKDELHSCNRDWLGKYEGASKLALRPQSTSEVAQILQHCSARRLAVVPQGGNTGLVGGGVPVFDEVVLQLSRMSRIRSFDSVGGILTCDAGCILESLDEWLSSRGHTVPLDLGAKGSCQIGGNVSTNAGGVRLLRYGSLHGSVLGLEVVLADGTVLDMLQTLRKDNTGYDLKQLFIGAEGTLGVVTGVSLLCPAKPSVVNVAFLACASFDRVQALFCAAKAHLGEVLSAFEFLDDASLGMALDHLPDTRSPFHQERHPLYVLVETSGSQKHHDEEKVESFLSAALEEGLAQDAVLAADSAQIRELWRLREGVTEALCRAGVVYKYDVSMPVSKMYALVEAMRQRLSTRHPDVTVVGYGHVGDGNLHLNISAPERSNRLLNDIEPFVYEWTSHVRGSISAEHGLGQMKANCIHYSKSDTVVQLMARMKQLLDPAAILNPYKVLPAPRGSAP